MSEYVFFLAAFLGLLSILNKILLAADRPSGWVSGGAIGILSSAYFYAVGLKIVAVAEFGFFVVMLLGYVGHYRPSAIRSRHITVGMTAGLVILSIVLFSGTLTIVESAASLSFVWGGYALAVARKTVGWLLFLFAHITTSLAAYGVGEALFAGMQLVSAVVCAVVLGKLVKSRSTSLLRP